MPPCNPIISFRQVIEMGHPFVPTHPDAVEGLHLPGARPIHPPATHEDNPELKDDTSDEALGDNAGGAGAAQPPQAQAQQAPMANPPPNQNANVFGVEAVIKEKIRALVAAFRRLFPVMMVERWLRRAIRDQ